MATPGFNEEHYLSQKLSSLTSQGETQSDGTAFTTTAQVKEAIEAAGLTPESHYEQFGFKEVIVADDDSTTRLTPNDNFVAEEYIAAKAAQLVASDSATYPTLDDAQQAFLDALDGGNVYNHYLEFGDTEGLNPSNSFDADQYFQDKLTQLQSDSDSFDSNSTVDDVKDAFADAGLSAIEHFELFGSDEGLSATAVATADEVDPLGALPAPEGEEGETFTLTTSIDDLTGTANDDTFKGFYQNGNDDTFETADEIDGGEGDDTLEVTITDNTPNPIVTLDAVETVAIQTTVTETVQGDNWTGVETVVNDGSSGILTVDNLSAITKVTLDDADAQTDIQFQDDVVSGSADALTVDLQGGVGTSNTDADLDVGNQAGIGNAVIESVTVNASDSDSNFLDLAGLGTGLTSLTVKGAGAVDLAALETDNMTTVDASAATGDVTLDLNDQAADLTITGGSGDDSFDLSGNYDTDDTVDGGDGTDTLVLNVAEADPADAQDNVSNMESLAIADDAGSDEVDAGQFGSVTSLEFRNDITGVATVAGLASGSVLTFADGVADIGVDVDLSDASGEGDSITVNIEETDTAVAGADNLDLSGIEDVTLDVSAQTGANTTTTEIVDAQLETLSVAIGDGDVDLNAVELGSNVTDVTVTEAGDGGLLVDLDSTTAIKGASVTATGNADTIGGSSQADTITLGAGADQVTANAGADTLTGGDGDDTFIINDFAAVDTVTDFESGSDVLQFDNAGLGASGLTNTGAGSNSGILLTNSMLTSYDSIDGAGNFVAGALFGGSDSSLSAVRANFLSAASAYIAANTANFVTTSMGVTGTMFSVTTSGNSKITLKASAMATTTGDSVSLSSINIFGFGETSGGNLVGFLLRDDNGASAAGTTTEAITTSLTFTLSSNAAAFTAAAANTSSGGQVTIAALGVDFNQNDIVLI